MRRAVWQWLLVSFALVWGASGCSCGKPPVESQLQVSFQAPTDGQRLTSSDDADPATDGFQYEVVAVASDTSGRAVTLASAKLEVQTPSSQTSGPVPDAVIDGSTVRFPGTLLQSRTNVLKVTVEEAGSHRTATQQISVTVTTEPATVELTQPAEGQVLRETDDADPDTAGYQLSFSVKSTGLAGKSGTLYCEQACGVPPTDFTVNSSGQTKVSLTLTQSACEAQNAACYAVVRNGDKEVTSGKRNIVLDTVAPRVEVASPVAPVSSTSFKVEAAVGCTEPNMVATLSRDGAPDISTLVVGAGVTFPSVTVPVDGQYTYTLRVADSGGNVTTRQIPVTVASTTPTLKLGVSKTITSDTVDGRLDNGVQAPVNVQVDSLPVGTEVRLFTSVNGQFARPQRAATAVLGISRVASFIAQFAEGANTVQACVSNAAGLEQCTADTVTVSTSRPTCRIISPLDGTLLRAQSGSVRVESGVGPVTVVAYDLTGVEKARVSGTAASGSAQVSLTLPADGEYQLVASCPGSGTSQRLSVGADTAAPALSFDVHGEPAGQTTLGTELNDTSLNPGMQVSLDVTTEPRASVLATGCGTVGAVGQADPSGALLLRNISVPDSGTCDLQLTATDLAGNTNTVTKTLTLAFSGGTLKFESPAAGRYLGAEDGVGRAGGGLTVSVKLSVTATAAGTLRLMRGTTEIASTPVAANDTEKTFTDVALDEGANVLRAELTGPGGTVACATILLLVDTQPGNISLKIPAGSPDPYRAALDGSPELAGIQAPLQYDVPNRSANAVVDICTSIALVQGASPCRDGSGWFTLAANVPAFVPNFTYPDGKYSLKAVLDDGAISVSQEVNLTVDSVEPVVRAVELVGDANGDKRLNASELPSGPAQVRVTVDGLEDGRPVQVRNSTLNIIYGQATASGGQATVDLTTIPTGVAADYSLVVTVTDAAGNQNRVSNPTVFYPLNTAAFFSFRLDRVLSIPVLNAPTRTSLGIADDGSSSTAGFQLLVSVNTDSDVGPGGVHMDLSPSGGAVDVTPLGVVASNVFTLPGSGTVTYTLTITATDSSGNHSAPLVRTLTVDLDAPTVSLVTPSAGTTYTTTDLPVQVNVGGGDVGSVHVVSQVGSKSVTVGDLLVVSGVAQGTLNFPCGLQTVSVTASDAAGNSASASAANVNVDVPGGCTVITNPPSSTATLLVKDDRDPGTPGLQFRLTGNTSYCCGLTVYLYRGASTTPEATATADENGDFFFDVALADGEQTRLTVEVISTSGEHSSDYVDVTVDITPPSITSVSPAPTTLYFVASTNAFLFPTPAPDRVVDLSPGGDADAQFTLTVAQGAGSKVQAFYQGTPVSSEFTLSTDPETLNVPVVLPQDTAGTFEIRVQDPSGNITRHTVAATVDVVPPAAPTVTQTLVAGQERAANVDVMWTASGDDGLSGTVAGYDLRWTVNAQLKNGITDDTTFFGAKVKQETGDLLPATATSYRLTLPPMANYSIQLRPRDEVGNYPPFQATAQINNIPTPLLLINPAAAGNSFALFITSRGDLNADGFDDLVVGASTGSNAPGTVYVYYGASDVSAVTPQALLPPDNTAGQFYGGDFDVGDVGNATTDAVQDLIVGARGWQSSGGRVLLYFGRKGAQIDTTAPIEFRNVPNVPNALLGAVVKMVGDINGDGLQELVMSSNGENPGKAYLFYGRSPDAWRALGTGCTATAPCVVPTSAADKVFSAPATTPALPFFGRARGYAKLGDITGDGVQDFTLPTSYDSLNNVYVYSGSTVRSLPALGLPDALQTLHQDQATSTNSLAGFGTDAFGGLDLAGGPGLDLVVGMSTQSKVFVYRDGTAAGFTTPPLVIQGGSRLGSCLGHGDINGDGRQDIAVGQNVTSGGAAFIFYNRGVPGAEFDTVQEDGFFQSRLEAPPSSIGLNVAVLDFNGDGKPDVAVSDSQSNPAKVLVYY